MRKGRGNLQGQDLSHKGEEIGKLVEKCIRDWGIEKVFTITVDNASSNDVAIGYLKRKWSNLGICMLGGVRSAVKYIIHFPSRLAKFKERTKDLKIESKGLLCLDVSTRWNITYLMLDVALRYEKIFEAFEDVDCMFKSEMLLGNGLFEQSNWDKVRMCLLLKKFYDLTVKISGSSYVTTNLYLDDICDIDLRLMAKRMKEKYDKYWGNIERKNMLLYVASILDPRKKLDSCQVNECSFQVRVNLDSANSVEDKPFFSKYKRFKKDSGKEETKSELEKYLAEDDEKDNGEFDVLGWWKINALRYPIMSTFAKDVMAVPISTVASESTFSTGGQVLDAYRSCLTSPIVQALICAQDWLHGSTSFNPDVVEDDVAQLEKVDWICPSLHWTGGIERLEASRVKPTCLATCKLLFSSICLLPFSADCSSVGVGVCTNNTMYFCAYYSLQV
ncbi:hypothetical protein PTKIN_Ptkin03bG0071800 [Pterospermum kingtungense]